MISSLSVVTIVVDDQDEAIEFYTDRLGFELRSDDVCGLGVRWVTVAPPDQQEVVIHLQEPHPAMHGEDGAARLRELVGNTPTWSFTTDDIEATYDELQAAVVSFVEPPADRPYGVETIFEDLYGNQFSLIEPSES